VIVTGAAGAIGSRTAAAFLDAGYNVLGLDRLTVESARDADILVGPHPQDRASGGYLHAVVDVMDARQLADTVERHRSMGPLAHLVSIAGGAAPGETAVTDPADVDDALFRSSIELNLVAQFGLVRCCLPWLRQSAAVVADRSIALTSSLNGLRGVDLFGYSAAKAGVNGLARVLSTSLGPEGIRVNAVAPGTVRTPRTEHAWAHDHDHFDRLSQKAALERLSTAEEVGQAFLALASALTSVTGHVLCVDAGQTVAWRY